MKTSVMCCLTGILLSGCSHNPVGPGPSPAPNTSKYELGYVNSLAESYGKGLRLMIVVSHQVKIDGTSGRWQYVFADSAAPHSTYWFHADSGGVVLDSIGAALIGSGIISQNWFNSDSALSIAEQHGGSQFRAQNPHYTIAASLGEPVLPNPKAYWHVAYQSTDSASKILELSIDATGGQAVPVYSYLARGGALRAFTNR